MTAKIIPNSYPTDTAVVLAASRRLWGSAAYPSERGTGNRRMVAKGDTLISEFGTLPNVTVAVHDTSFRHDGDGPTTVSYLI